MALLAYNMTAVDLALSAGNPIVTLPASLVAGKRGPAVNVTSELLPDIATIDPAKGIVDGLELADFVALQLQVAATNVQFEWTDEPEYLTTGLRVGGTYRHHQTHIVGDGTLGGIISLGGNKTIALYDISMTVFDAIVNGVFAEMTALTDEVLIGVGEWGNSFDLSGAAAVVLTADGQAYEFALVCVNVSGAPTLYAIFGAEDTLGAQVAPTTVQINTALTAAAVAGMDLTSGFVVGRAKIQRDAVDTMVLTNVDPAGNAALRGERLVSSLGY